jgi:hypothetical protein
MALCHNISILFIFVVSVCIARAAAVAGVIQKLNLTPTAPTAEPALDTIRI